MPADSSISRFLPSLNKSHLVQADIAPIIGCLKDHPQVDVQLVGHSFEQRPLHLLSLGNGPLVIFAWTQMHGNEATATAAVFDLIDSLLSNNNGGLAGWESAFTLHILPMLNPDGAQRCTRQNAQAIDINRDARELQSPEGRLLMTMVEQLAPDVGFNLHDQSPYYQCGTNTNPATIAFLAPAFDESKTIDNARKRAMILIAHMNKSIQSHIPNCVARYDDTYSTRSFGDNIAAKKVSTILIESGAARNDNNRQIAREMNVRAMLCAFEYLLQNSNKETSGLDSLSIDDYFAIPENVSETLSSLVIRRLSFNGKQSYTAGISIKQTARYSDKFVIDFVGDLHTQAGLVEFDAQGMQFVQGKVFSASESLCLTADKYIELLRQGYLYFDDPENYIDKQTSLDICLNAKPLHEENSFVLQQEAYCLFAKKDAPNEALFALLNGKILSLI